MRLSEVLSADTYIKRDGEFNALGLSNTNVNCRLLSFLEDEKFFNETLRNSNITALVTTREIAQKIDRKDLGIICVESPRLFFFDLHNHLSNRVSYRRKDFQTLIGENCNIHPLASIASENVFIGNNVVIEEFVSIKGACRIEDNCIIHSGVQIGGAGFEFKMYGDKVLDVEHCGGVVINQGTIIWSNTTIHKAVFPWDDTYIGSNVRINSNSHIDHGAKIGDQVRISAGCIVSGRTEIRKGAVLGPGAIVSNRMIIGEDAKVSLGGVVTKNVSDGERVSGNFAICHEIFMENLKELAAKNIRI